MSRRSSSVACTSACSTSAPASIRKAMSSAARKLRTISGSAPSSTTGLERSNRRSDSSIPRTKRTISGSALSGSSAACSCSSSQRVCHSWRSRPGSTIPPPSSRLSTGWLPVMSGRNPLGGARQLAVAGDDRVAELRGELAEGLALELADTLTRDPELLADRLQRHLLAVEAEPQLQDATLPLGQVLQGLPYLVPPHRVPGLLGRVLGAGIGEQVAELTVALAADGLVERGRHLGDVERLLDVLELQARRLGELLCRRSPLELELQALPRPPELDPPLVDVSRDTDRPRLVRHRTLTGLANPPGRVGRELEALPPVELLGGAVEADDAVLDQVAQGHALPLVALRDPDHEAQVAVDHPRFRLSVAALDPLGQLDLLGGGQKGIAADLVHEHRQRVRRHELGRRSGDRLQRHACWILALYLDVARLELRAHCRELVLVEIVLERQRLERLLGDRPALLGVLDEDRQVSCCKQVTLTPFPVVGGRRPLVAAGGTPTQRSKRSESACYSPVLAVVAALVLAVRVDSDDLVARIELDVHRGAVGPGHLDLPLGLLVLLLDRIDGAASRVCERGCPRLRRARPRVAGPVVAAAAGDCPGGSAQRERGSDDDGCRDLDEARAHRCSLLVNGRCAATVTGARELTMRAVLIGHSSPRPQ